MTDEINLTWTESLQVAQLGVMWELSAIFGKRGEHAYEHPQVAWKAHIEGAAAEYAVAKFLGIFWEPFCNQPHDVFVRKPDVGPFQVRNGEKHHYRLTLRPGRDEEKPNVPFILCTGILPNFRVRGWLYGREVIQAKYYEDPGNKGAPAWWAPIADLRTMESLRMVEIDGWAWQGDRWVKAI